LVLQFRDPWAGIQQGDPVGKFMTGYERGKKAAQQKALGQAAQKALPEIMEGNLAAINAIAAMPGGGPELAKNLMAIAQSQDKFMLDRATQALTKRGRMYSAIYDLPEEARGNQMKKLAIQVLNTGDRKQAEEIMRIGQLQDPKEIETELLYGINLAAAGDEYLREWKKTVYGDVEKIREERRSLIDRSMTNLNTRIDAIQSSADKIESLVDQAQQGNRSAVSSVLVALVKLQDPNSAVLEGEMLNALNAKDPKAAVMDLIRGKGTVEGVADSTIAMMDPLAPGQINPVQIRATRDALVKANLVPMQQLYMDNMMKAEGLSKAGKREVMRGNFGQRLLDMYGQYNVKEDQQSQNTGNLFYNELNRQREKLGEDSLIRPLNLADPNAEQETDIITEIPVVGAPQVDTKPQAPTPQVIPKTIDRVEAPAGALNLLRNDPSEANKQYFMDTFNYLPEEYM
jgi:hypothetical protein